MPKPTHAQNAQQFQWIEAMCKKARQMLATDPHDINALVLLEEVEEKSHLLAENYSNAGAVQNINLTPAMLTSLPPALTSRQIALFFGKYDPPVLTRIASQFLSYTGQEVYDNAVAGQQAKEFLDMAGKNIAEFAAYAGTINKIATEAQARIALAKVLFNMLNEVQHGNTMPNTDL